MFLSPQLLRLATDARLVALVRERNPAAFEAVYNRHHRAILSFCRHMLGDPQEAEDAVQQTFLAAYSDLISSDKPIQLRAWLFTIARNRCYSLLRGRREQPTAELEEPLTEGLASQVQRRQDLRDLVVDLRCLPDDQRAALVLAELDALSHEEIAIALDVPREKVKALVFQARESLVASRAARETDCTEIREQLATQRGGALRRGNLRRHLRDCAGCRDFRRQVERQRRQLAALLPVVPTVALKEGVLGATVGGGAAAGVGTGGLLISTALKSGLAKGALGALLAGAGAATTLVATHNLVLPSSPAPSHRQQAANVAAAPAGSARTTTTTRALAAGTVPSAGVRPGPRSSAASGAVVPAATSSTHASGGSFIRAASLNPFARRLGVPKALKGGAAPRSPVAPRPPVAPVSTLPPRAPVAATPTVIATPAPGSTSGGSIGHGTATAGTVLPTGSNRGDQGRSRGGQGGRPGSSGTAHGGGGDTGSGTPVPQRGGPGAPSGGTRGQGATGSSGAGGAGSTGNTGTTGETGSAGTTGNTGSTSRTGNTGAGATGITAPGATGNTGPGATGNTGGGNAGTTGSGSTNGPDAGGRRTATLTPSGPTVGEPSSRTR